MFGKGIKKGRMSGREKGGRVTKSRIDRRRTNSRLVVDNFLIGRRDLHESSRALAPLLYSLRGTYEANNVAQTPRLFDPRPLLANFRRDKQTAICSREYLMTIPDDIR